MTNAKSDEAPKSLGMSPMETATRTAITAIVAGAERLVSEGDALAALEMYNAARHLLDQSPFISDAQKAVMDNELEGAYFTAKAVWKSRTGS